MATGWIILAQFVCIQLASGACPSSKTGPRCTYDCHCNSSPCDESSNCGGSCVNGWRGRTCQQENVAFGKATESSSTRNAERNGPERAVDGKLGGEGNEFHTAIPTPSAWSAWWSVDLQTSISVQDVVIYFRTDYKVHRNGVELYVSNTKPIGTDQSTWGSLCYTVQGRADGTNINDTFSIPQCQGSWRYLFTYTDTDNSPGNDGPILDFREVEVYACARGTYGSDCSQFCDGCNSDGCDSSGHCHLGCRPGKVTPPRCTEDCPPERYGAGCASVCSDRGCMTSSDSCNAETGVCPSGCKSNGFSTPDCSVCRTGWYGDGCDKQCNLRQCAMLQQNSICDRTRVACPIGGCKPGYTGNDCATVCLKSYGENCSNSCNSRHCADNSSICPHITGACVPEECKPGFLGNDCQQVCTPGTYGRGCILSCGDRKCFRSSSSCDHVTGQCDAGCKAGWNGSDCTQECLNGTYGANCVKSCSSRHCRTPSSSCDRETGQCPDGCQDGRSGQDCSTACPSGKYGVNCMETCVHCIDTCDVVDGHCLGGCEEGYCGAQCHLRLMSDTGVDSVSAVIGAVIGAVVMFVVIGAVLFCLLRYGRLQWMTASRSKDLTQRTQMTDIARPNDISHDVPERSGSSHIYNNDYAVLDTDTKSDNKHYDVIKTKHYENL